MAHQPSGQSKLTSRRAVLSAAGAGVTAALAGCSDSQDEDPVRMRTATEGTTAYAANQGITAVVNEYTDNLFAEAQTSRGTEANIGALSNEEAEMVYLQNWSAHEISEGTGQLGDLDFQISQVFHYYDLPWFFCTANEDLETLTDITEDHGVSPTPEGSGTAPALEHALDAAVDDYERESLTYGEQSSAMQEGRLDVGVGTYMNFDIEPGWLQEMMSTVDLSILDVDDDVLAEWEDDDRLLIESFDGAELEEGEATPASVPDEVHCPTFAYNFMSRADLDYDLVYNFLELMHEHRAELEEYSAVLAPLEDEEFWLENAYDDIPFHAAAADFYEELGIWQDEFERADEP
ncbi:TRAP-type transport system periplasmic substrate-binding protein [Natrialba magadii ATCC 43099]|uniref:TRAP transporter solute receptor, TAXI family protein n=1 Tax=Natrialba magadii (strain ATCC 43099 / DSM 3394 / CCM 3739 / CIP 104546 / IAM 13178 / JCM 8861 / NBRC 102185 / NCIMB 2190 / MS3) TaxID=547559 RepID=D3T0H8_NATMM|nr:TAXI family TRAP transporter solute-binding subunit [Natrialba magadii]ADD06457.1 TRAP-type transport system periplasmic substrate-binding protein [Natrialba magadii ATCC 43099]ELY31655.1 TRAP transporter solute receptor, TAXI family protein [Natrialba magadii ATCC 43099]